MITIAKEHDAAALSEIYDICFAEEMDSCTYFRRTLADQKFPCFKLVQNSKIVALCLCMNIPPEMEILSICVLPEFRRQGVAKSLLFFLINYAEQHDIESIFLEVSVENPGAIKLYESVGFHKIGIRKGYYRLDSKNVDALLYKYSVLSM